MKLVNKTNLCLLLALSWSIKSFAVAYVSDFIKLYERPITFLGLLENDENLFIEDLAKKNNNDVFVVWGQGKTSLANSLPGNFIYLDAHCDIEAIEHLGESEHFDVVFIKKSLYSFGIRYAKALFNLGENVFVLVPRKENAFIQCLLSNKFKCIVNYNNGESLFYSSHSIKFLMRTQWLEPASNSNHVRHISSTYKEKILYKNYGSLQTSSMWQPGINLMTFKMLNGRIPLASRLQAEVARLFGIDHLDWMPNNMVVQGDCLTLIDYEEPWSNGPKAIKDAHMLKLVTQFVVEPMQENIPSMFEKILAYCREKLHPKNESFLHINNN